MNANVLNRFEQPASGSQDNVLKLEGTVKTGAGNDLKKRVLQLTLDDISTAGTKYVVAPEGGTITKITGVLGAAITVASANVNVVVNGVNATGTLTVPVSGSAAGAKYTANVTALNTFVAGDVLSVVTDGASTTAATFSMTIEYEVA